MTKYTIREKEIEGPIIGATVELPDDAIAVSGQLRSGGIRRGSDLRILYLEPSKNCANSEGSK